jgi:hypothetical protein
VVQLLPSSVELVAVFIPKLLMLALILLVKMYKDSLKIPQTTQVLSQTMLVTTLEILLAWELIFLGL